MRFRIEVNGTAAADREIWQPATFAWTVRARNLDADKPVEGKTKQPIRRCLAGVGDAPAVPFPLPPRPEQPPAAASTALADVLCFELSTATDAITLEGLLTKFVTKTLKDDEVDGFGRYLFDTLVGQELWQAIDAEAGSDWIDLVLALPATEPALTRLPWELMRNADGFLALSAKLSLTREIASAASFTALDRAPRVLFIVGTELNDDVVRPGAEYLQIVRGLRARQFNLKTKLLCRATANLVAVAVDELRPDIVHFIGHGAVDDKDRPYIEFLDESNPSKRKPAFADAVKQMLCGKNGAVPLPRMVVLSACYTAVTKVSKAGVGEIAAGGVSKVGQVATPLAAYLVKEGVPVVVAMSGSVSDQASRLFTRQFYESAASENDVAHATALGRRAAIRDGGADPRSAVDWAFPTIFVSSALKEPRLALSPAPGTESFHRLARWTGLVDQWPYRVPPLFCDRFDVLERFDLLVADHEMQRALTKNPKLFSVLAIAVVEQESQAEKFGRSWLLRELAAKAYADGHLPVVISKIGGNAPTSFNELVDAIIDNTEQVLALLDLADQRFDLVAMLREIPANKPLSAGVDIPVEIASRPNDRDENAFARALRHDLLRLLRRMRETCRAADEADRCRLVLLVDDVHRMAKGAQAFLGSIIGKVGLSNAGQDIRIVFTWSLPPQTSEPAAGQQPAIDEVKNWLQDQHELTRMSIGKFGRRSNPQPLSSTEREAMLREERLSYEYYLLHRQGLAARSGETEASRIFWTMFSKLVKGVPSLLEPETERTFEDETPDWVKAIFQPANDDAWLKRARQEKRNQ